MAGFMCFAAEASGRLPDSAYHSRAARERADGDYAFTARAFPHLFEQTATTVHEIRLDQLTPLELNDRCAPSSEGNSVRSEACSSSSAVSPYVSASSGLSLTLHESHSGHLIGSVVWDGGKALAWVLESMHSRVRQVDFGNGGFWQENSSEIPPINAEPSASSFTAPATMEYLTARENGFCFDLPRDFLVGARVLELGAGTGVTGLACVMLGAREVAITDIAELVPLMKENVRRNCPGMLREEYGKAGAVDRQVQLDASTLAPATTASAPSAAPLASTASPSSIPDVSSHQAEIPLSALYLTCSNCDDLCEQAWCCTACDEPLLCDPCDAAYHRPAGKSGHKRQRKGLGYEESHSSLAHSSTAAASSTSLGPTSSSNVATAAAVSQLLPSLPPRCDVYCEELLWGEQSSLADLAPSLRAPFDVIIMADVVYDAYSTIGKGSDRCDTFRKLFATLCLLTTSNTTVLMTYTPRRAPEKAFFELLATEFVWTTYQAKDLLPAHDNIDERIWIYHLVRTKLAGRINATKQRVYLHEDQYGSEIALNRARDAEDKQRRAKVLQEQQEIMQQVASSSSSSPIPLTPSTQPRFVSASAPPPSVPTIEEECKSSGPTLTRLSSAETDSSRAPTQPQNLGPRVIRHLESEEERQQAMLQQKLQRRAAMKKTTESQLLQFE